MNHSEHCFISRLHKGMRIWGKKNPEPNENLDEKCWTEWFKRRCAVEAGGIKKLCEELGIAYSRSIHWNLPCTCESKKNEAEAP